MVLRGCWLAALLSCSFGCGLTLNFDPDDEPDAGSDASRDTATDVGESDTSTDGGTSDSGPPDVGPPDVGPPVDADVDASSCMPCETGFRCDEVRSLCVECLDDAECRPEDYCAARTGVCEPRCTSPDECEPSEYCDPSGRCKAPCDVSDECAAGRFCTEGECIEPCAFNEDCPDEYYCDESRECLLGCRDNSSCGGEICLDHECTPRCVPGECEVDDYCDVESGECTPRCTSASCLFGETCDLEGGACYPIGCVVNGRRSPGEMCDDGNDIDDDGCSNDCIPGCMNPRDCGEPRPCATYVCTTPTADGSSICLEAPAGVTDADGDGYPSADCARFVPGPYDCYDEPEVGARVNPDGTFSATPYGPDRSFDYNCDEEEEPEIGPLNCEADTVERCLARPQGWIGEAPVCGARVNVDGCIWRGGRCVPEGSPASVPALKCR